MLRGSCAVSGGCCGKAAGLSGGLSSARWASLEDTRRPGQAARSGFQTVGGWQSRSERRWWW